MNDEIWAVFRALGDPTRFKIFDFLRTKLPVALGEQGEVHRLEGPTVGQVCCHITGIEKANTGISFHLKELRTVGLITMEKRGKYMVCGVNPGALEAIGAWLNEGPKESCR